MPSKKTKPLTKTTKKKTTNKTNKVIKRSKRDKEEFKKYLERIEDPKYEGADVSWDLPENATPLEKAKYELCEKILVYQQDHHLTDEEMAKKIHLTIGEVRDILYCHLDYFTLDRLITYATRLFKPLEIKMTVEPKKVRRTSYAQVV